MDAALIPLPTELTTPPVTKTYLVTFHPTLSDVCGRRLCGVDDRSA